MCVPQRIVVLNAHVLCLLPRRLWFLVTAAKGRTHL